MTFSPNPIQLSHALERGPHRYNLIVKYRQGGVTTFYAIDLLDEALWIQGMTCAIMAHEAKRLPEYFDIIERAYENLPEQIKPKTSTDTKHRYDFTFRFDGMPLDSSIYVATSVRGGTVQNLHITESAYIKDRQELNAGDKQAVPLTGRISEETTGNGFNEFYDFYMLSRNIPDETRIEQDYKTYFYPWVIDPTYTLPGVIEHYTTVELHIKETSLKLYGIFVTDGQLLWRRWKKNELKKEKAQIAGGNTIGLNGDQLFRQEYPLTLSEAFQSGAGGVFDGEMVDNMPEIYDPMTKLEADERYLTKIDLLPSAQDKEDLVKMMAAFYKLRERGVMFWHLPEKGQRYVIGCDPTDGQGSDNGVVDVWDADTMEQVAQFYGKLRSDELAELLADLGYFYNHAFVGVENNMISTVLFLSKIYDNYFFSNTVDEKTRKRTKKLGFNTNTKTRNLVIDNFIVAFEDGSVTIHSKITQSEMKTFVKKANGKREHADGKHDDTLFAGFITLHMINYYPRGGRVFESASGLT